MKLLVKLLTLGMVGWGATTIMQNGQVKITDYPNTKIDASSYDFNTYAPNATELSYKGRWDSKYISWWSAPGLKFGFTGETVAITFGPLTSDQTLVGYRINGLDWQFTNVTANATHLLISPSTPNVNVTYPIDPSTFELRVTNWAYGVQIDRVHVAAAAKLIKLPDYGRSIEIIGDSLSAGMYTSYEGLSSYAYALGAGLGNTEYSITAYPGICMVDQNCWGNPRGQSYQWFRTSDTSSRAAQIWGDTPELWDFSKQKAADLVFFMIGTNDNNAHNNVSTSDYVEQYTKLIEQVHGVWPDAQIVLISLWSGFYGSGNSYFASPAYVAEIYGIYEHFNSPAYLNNSTSYSSTAGRPKHGFVHYFNTTGIMQHNDIGPQWHPTDFGAIKVASHLLQWVKLTFDWDLEATGPEVMHDTLYWNDEQYY